MDANYYFFMKKMASIISTPSFWYPGWLDCRKRFEESRRKTSRLDTKERIAEREKQKRKVRGKEWDEFLERALKSDCKPTAKKTFPSLRNHLHQVFKTQKVHILEDKDVAKVHGFFMREEYRKKFKEDREKQVQRDEENYKRRNQERKRLDEWTRCALEKTPKPRRKVKDTVKREETELDTMRAMWFFHTFSFSAFTREQHLHLYRIKVDEDKQALKEKNIKKVTDFLGRERGLEEQCSSHMVLYLPNDPPPGKQWRNTGAWHSWYGTEHDRIEELNKQIKEVKRQRAWQNLSEDAQQEILEYNLEYNKREKERRLREEELRRPTHYRRTVTTPEIIAIGSIGGVLEIDPSWSPGRRSEEIQSAREAVMDF